MRTWDAATGEPLLRISCDGFDVSALAVGDLSGRPILATATTRYARLQVWDAITGEQIGKGLDVGRRVNPMTATSLRITRWRDKTVVLAAAKGWPPFLWIIG
ncbi:hypothetical protein [Actinoplanes derwentensis]|uniref:hypothetical protein n=1 Tax=Actinoplanes derwentensis TaxID=113562 RepID=UPI000B81D7E6|nr:hypothetical protein [Actinoplanes derwentensis]GID81152.1 hypothetical protein Ade03nite_00760 [Actinoplanes derwentensis]